MNERTIDPWEQDSYQTGSTQPPKSRGGLVAVLFVTVILLCGITTALGVMNVRLFKKLQDNHAPMAFYPAATSDTKSTAETPTANHGSGEAQPELDVLCETVSPRDQCYYDLPAGVLVVHAAEAGPAAKAGIKESDIITRCNGADVKSVEELTAALEHCQPGQPVDMTLYRHRTKSELSVTVTLEGKNG